MQNTTINRSPSTKKLTARSLLSIIFKIAFKFYNKAANLRVNHAVIGGKGQAGDVIHPSMHASDAICTVTFCIVLALDSQHCPVYFQRIFASLQSLLINGNIRKIPTRGKLYFFIWIKRRKTTSYKYSRWMDRILISFNLQITLQNTRTKIAQNVSMHLGLDLISRNVISSIDLLSNLWNSIFENALTLDSKV